MVNKRLLGSLCFLMGIVTLVITNAASASWSKKSVDAPKWFSWFYSRNIAVDTKNHPHIAYGSDHLYYSYYNGSSWTTKTVDSSPGVGSYASLALDSAGKVHISYFDATNFTLKYATNASGDWVKKTVDNSGYVGMYTSIAVDNSDKVHISYLDISNQVLKYATNTNGDWVTTIADNTKFVGYFTSMATDSNNKVHISYCYYDTVSMTIALKYANNVAGSWMNSTVDNSGGSGWYTSIAIDSQNKVHISYFDDMNYDLKYANNTSGSGSWTIKTVDSQGDVGYCTSIAVKSDKVR